MTFASIYTSMSKRLLFLVVTIVIGIVGVALLTTQPSPKVAVTTNELPTPILLPLQQQTATPVPTINPPNIPPPLPALSDAVIFNLINSYRSTSGLAPLSTSSELCSIANSRADYLIANNMEAARSSVTGNHTGFRDQTSIYSGGAIGENLYQNAMTNVGVLIGWEDSAPHNALMLATNYNGVSITRGCVATRVASYGSIAVLEVGDK